MIEKLSEYKITSRDGGDFINVECNTKIINMLVQKINEIINVLNAIVVDTKGGTFIDGSKKVEPTDQYEEQRKWIGKLCKFWDDNYKITKHFGILTRIDEKAIATYEAENGFWYCACEPVKSVDDLIYKGE